MRRHARVAWLAAVQVWVAAWLAVCPAHAEELVRNGGFESGTFGPSWVHGAYRNNKQNPDLGDNVVLPDLPYSGNYSALLGFKYTGQGNAAAYMYQDVTIPAGISQATLRFHVRMQGYDGDFYADFIADIRDTNGNVLQNVLRTHFDQYDNQFKDSNWITDDGVAPEGVDVTAYAGQTIRLYFEQANLNDNNLQTWAYVDDVSLVCRHFVDAVIGGDGDDRFGTPGTGAGGYEAASGIAGDTLRTALDVENDGPDADRYQVTASAPAGFELFLDDGTGPVPLPVTTPTIAAGETRHYQLVLVTPAGAPAGAYDAMVDVASADYSNRYDSVRLHTNLADAIYGADLRIDGNGAGVVGDGGTGGFSFRTGVWDTPVVYALDLVNTGNQATSYHVAAQGAPGSTTVIRVGGVGYSAPFDTPVVPDGGSLAMTLETTIPAATAGGDYPTIVTAAAAGDSLRRDSVRAVLRLLEPRVDMILAGNGDNIYDRTFSGLGGASTVASQRGLVVSFPVRVQNESELPDSFELDWVPPAGGWSANIDLQGITIGGTLQQFPVVTPTIPPHGEGRYVVQISIRNGATYGTYRSFLNAVSQTDPRVSESVSPSISIASSSEIDMLIDGNGQGLYGPIGTGLGGISEMTASPGDTVTFDVTILNVSGVDSFDVAWTPPPGWDVTFAGSTTPAAGIPAGTYPLRVIVPDVVAGGTFDIIVDGSKSGKPYLNDSVTGRVIVAPPPRVDALIDGNGDGVYGATGTGGGGASRQSATEPATVRFTVELQNEGSTADQYRVTWGAVPGWGATFDGAVSPVVTPFIAAGASEYFSFDVTVPAGTPAGTGTMIIDVASVSDSSVVESVEAQVDVVGPPRPDLVIDGNGAGQFGPLGSGQGGTSLHAVDPGATYVAALRVENVGSFADSFRVRWSPPAGWPAGSITIGGVSGGALWTPALSGGQGVDYTVTVHVPASASGQITAIIDAWSALRPDLTESVALVTETRAVIRGTVVDDRDHDGAPSAGDVPLAGVVVTERTTGTQVQTDAAGEFVMDVPGGTAVTVIEANPPGYVSLSPDTLGPFVAAAGDTVRADFADVGVLTLTPGSALPAIAGATVDFPHVLTAGTAGHVDVSATSDGGAVATLFLDENADGVFDGNDRPLAPGDTDLDPAGRASVALLVRVFIPAATPPATTIHVGISAVEAIAGGPTLSASASDAAVVGSADSGRLVLTKSSDRVDAAPGDVITYTIRFFNSGADSVGNVVLLDPISPWVDPEPDAFGPGEDVALQSGGGAPVYLTFDPGDADECEYDGTARLLRVILSKNVPRWVAPGQGGQLVYRVRVR